MQLRWCKASPGAWRPGSGRDGKPRVGTPRVRAGDGLVMSWSKGAVFGKLGGGSRTEDDGQPSQMLEKLLGGRFRSKARGGAQGTWVQGGAHENLARVHTPEAERLAQHRAPGRLAPTPTPDACVEALTPTVILFRTRGLWEGTGAG